MKNTTMKFNKPFFIFSENKNNTINIDRKSLTYENVAATIINNSDNTKNIISIQFEAGFAKFSLFLDLLEKDRGTIELRNFLISQIALASAKIDILKAAKISRFRTQESQERLDSLNKRVSLDNTSLQIFNKKSTEALDLIKDKSGIYMFTNNINKKRYIGKAKNLQDRLKSYTNVNCLQKNVVKSKISRSLLEFGNENFSFSILEHCAPELLNKRERFYIKVFKPQYNIRKVGTEDISYPL
jgi:hypothetical protein